ncbi:MAG: hypothetical protein E7341_04860 [Clostridiales bacterium]|nr:hypothetical protein [Clostridiales bacterium]
MEEKDRKMLASYFLMYRELDKYHSDAEEFEQFKSWVALDANIQRMFDAFEEFYTKLDAELQTQGIKDAVLDSKFDPATLANPDSITAVIDDTLGSKKAGGTFLSALGGNWGKQRLAFNNIGLHYQILQLAEGHKDDPDNGAKLIGMLEGFLITYNEEMGSLSDLLNGRADKIDENQVEISNKLVEISTQLGKVFRKTKDLPALTSTVSNIRTMLKEVKKDSSKVNEALDKLGSVLIKLDSIQGIINTISADVSGLGSNFETKLEAFKLMLLQELKKMFNDELKGPLLEDFKGILVENIKDLFNSELKGPMLEEFKKFMLEEFGEELKKILGESNDDLLERFNNLLEEREKKKMSKFGTFLKKNWERVTAGVVVLGLGLTMGHFIAVSSNRSGELADLQSEAYAIYETYYGEGSAADMTLEEVIAALKSLETEKHSDEDESKIAGYDQAIADKDQAVANYNELMGKLSAEYEKTNGEGTAEGKTIEELLAGIAKDGGNIQTYEAEIVDLYDTLFPDGDAQNLEEMLAELNGASIKTEEDEAKIAEYDEVVSAIASTYTEVTGGDPTGLSVDDMLNAIAAAIENAGDTMYGRAIMLKLYENVMHESGEQYSDEELYKWVCQFYDLDETYIENDGLDSYEPEK